MSSVQARSSGSTTVNRAFLLLGKVFREEKTGCIVRRPEEIGVNRYSPVFLYVFSRHHIPGFNLLKPYGLSFREKTQFFHSVWAGRRCAPPCVLPFSKVKRSRRGRGRDRRGVRDGGAACRRDADRHRACVRHEAPDVRESPCGAAAAVCRRGADRCRDRVRHEAPGDDGDRGGGRVHQGRDRRRSGPQP